MKNQIIEEQKNRIARAYGKCDWKDLLKSYEKYNTMSLMDDKIDELANFILSNSFVLSSLPPVHIDSRQFSEDGKFHRYIDLEGKTYALIELENGRLNKYDLANYTITFLRQ